MTKQVTTVVAQEWRTLADGTHERRRALTSHTDTYASTVYMTQADCPFCGQANTISLATDTRVCAHFSGQEARHDSVLDQAFWAMTFKGDDLKGDAEMTQVVTYQAPSGGTIDLTQEQVQRLEASRVWPRNGIGEEYCSVEVGLHRGVSTYSDAEIDAMIEGR